MNEKNRKIKDYYTTQQYRNRKMLEACRSSTELAALASNQSNVWLANVKNNTAFEHQATCSSLQHKISVLESAYFKYTTFVGLEMNHMTDGSLHFKFMNEQEYVIGEVNISVFNDNFIGTIDGSPASV